MSKQATNMRVTHFRVREDNPTPYFAVTLDFPVGASETRQVPEDVFVDATSKTVEPHLRAIEKRCAQHVRRFKDSLDASKRMADEAVKCFLRDVRREFGLSVAEVEGQVTFTDFDPTGAEDELADHGASATDSAQEEPFLPA